MKYTFADVCFATHHLQFGFDANDTLWTSGGGPCRVAQRQGVSGDRRCRKIAGLDGADLDTNGNGKRDEYVEPNQPVRPRQGQAPRRRLLRGSCRARSTTRSGAPSSARGRSRGSIPAPTAPETALTEIYNVPARALPARAPTSIRRAWCGCRSPAAILGASTARNARPAQRSKATGDHCPEGWSFTQYPGPASPDRQQQRRGRSYYTWSDRPALRAVIAGRLGTVERALAFLASKLPRWPLASDTHTTPFLSMSARAGQSPGRARYRSR